MPVSGNRWKAILPIRGKLLAHVEKAAFPYGASTVPQNGTKVLYETLVKERIAKATELMTAPWLGDGEKKLGMI